jgi:predicted transposase/invertase (TIGR01784 family)
MQTTPKPDIPFRLLDYRIRLYRKFPNKLVKQVVIYLKPTNSNLVHQTTFEILGTIHNFEVIRLWEQPTSLFLKTLGLLPLAVLSNTPDRAETLRQAAEIINKVKDPKSQNTISAVTAILAGLLLDKEIISQLLRRDTMQESVIYQEILEEGIQKGRQEGIVESKIIIAKNLLSLGISLEQVAKATGLSLEEVEKL